jgi:hypothetical protein
MSESSEARYFVKLFVSFILIEIVLYTLMVYWDVLGIAVEGPVKKNPAFIVFYGLSSIIFVVFISRTNKR